MKKTLLISVFAFILVFSSVLSSVETYLPPKTEPNNIEYKNNKHNGDKKNEADNSKSSTSNPAEIDFSTVRTEKISLEITASEIIKFSEERLAKLIGFSSDNDKVACVDDGGRIDALNKGTAVIKADFSDGERYEYEITVTDKQKSVYDGFSTCIIANTDILSKNKNSKSEKNLFELRVNRSQNCVTAYTYDENGEYTVPVRSMVCSSGKNNSTVTGRFSLYFKNEWHPLYENVYGYYVSGISGDYLFHSVPYYHPKSDELKVDEYNKLGRQASLGCIRLAVADSKWIYKNCQQNTAIVIYDDDEASPLGKPESMKITDKKCGWDPTDSNKKNPYYSKKPTISGVKDLTLKLGEKFVPLENVSAIDTCSNDITSKVEAVGNVVTSRAGKYKVTYKVTDAMHRSAEQTITVTVTA